MARHRTRVRRGPVGYGSLPTPPPGTYDPSIDASERAAQRGYGDLGTDTRTQNLRSASDYAIGLEDIGRQRGYGLADLLRQQTRGGEDIGIEGAKIGQDYSRGLTDLLTARTREGQDYGSNIATLDRNYQRLGANQAQSASAMGTGAGGALLQALQKRQANETIDRQPIDTAHARFGADSALAESRLGENRDQAVSALDLARTRSIEDIGTSRERLTTQYGSGEKVYTPGSNPWVDAYRKLHAGYVPPGAPVDNGTAGQRLSLDYQRGTQDRATNLQRAGRELNRYQGDLIPTRYYSAAGLTPYTPPRRRRR